MTEQHAWRFTDDRGRVSQAVRRPVRILAYIQAGATLWDYGIRPDGIFGSGHDGSVPDQVKAGTLPLESVAYAGAGAALDIDALLRGAPDLVVAVSYGGGQAYGLAPETAKHLEKQVPVVVIDVGRARDFAATGERFAELAHSLGGGSAPARAGECAAARERLRAVAAAPERPEVLALSPAGWEEVHLARPGMWPELRVLAELGVNLVEPAEGPGASWSTVDRARAAGVRPSLVLADVRAHATPFDAFAAAPGRPALWESARVVPWNPEPLCSPQAHAAFLTLVADALEAVGPGERTGR
ncbi:ABC transporter substrate-binding protein [Streptomyces fulvorobeus]|uniref:ABC transporter substrate-binding protein n=1 Tax=Streptomyces fulvorobeus TaxID=284028 RepID=A0A7J0BZ09_9ACTN|nr:ABC transporter substrate-binding protein [Streptomyces fulvorobeus]NYE39281.1 iron complex transport system substrate-binding protein [Streptomyces fulvorobeus]GFM95495.1 ABC transporter substrate-binding protein [Streptomyces fulvorobeus]